MSYGKSLDERMRALLDRFYLDDEGVIRRREAEVHPSVRAAVGAERHEAYVALLNVHAHKRANINARDSRYVRVYKATEMRHDLAVEILREAGPAQREPMQVIAPEALWQSTAKRKALKARDRKHVRKMFEDRDGVIVWRAMDATQAGHLHPVLGNTAEAWNRRFAGKPVAVRTAGHSPYRYIKVGDKFMRVEQVIEMLKEDA